MGTMIEGIIDFNPFFGFEITYDVYQLLYKLKHPAILAVVATLDILDEALGDDFDIDLDLIVTTQVMGTLKGTVNTAQGSKYIDRLMKDEDDTPAKFGGAVSIELSGKIQANGEFNSFLFGKYNAYAKVSAAVQTGISMEFVTKANEQMLYLEPEIKFEGLILKAGISVGISLDGVDEDDEDDTPINNAGQTADRLENSNGIHYKNEGEVIVLDPYEWEMDKWRMKLFFFT